jgi:hypothetical protein
MPRLRRLVSVEGMIFAESDVALRDGATVHVRPVHPEDAAGLEAFPTPLEL